METPLESGFDDPAAARKLAVTACPKCRSDDTRAHPRSAIMLQCGVCGHSFVSPLLMPDEPNDEIRPWPLGAVLLALAIIAGAAIGAIIHALGR